MFVFSENLTCFIFLKHPFEIGALFLLLTNCLSILAKFGGILLLLRLIVLITQFPADLVTFTEEIVNGKLHFLYSVNKL